ncbi:penicillin acylase family protein [Gluconobacter albidus]|uniref:Penicillin acylase n=1 Tax=Gluconobacter albidus TaxID=318683 RepID=A0AAW3QU20_9PROT|nr:penicillin acylase family protein [Gluconobacter albidus]KXV37139.1 penicillin acylase [Gluconobacter albidus]GBQ85890.1 peptidase S45 penicillin amidase [Gluconobacter albidus NBRC 3250]GLQ67898.1 penicillin amidase [Gluconobacter albidus]
MQATRRTVLFGGVAATLSAPGRKARAAAPLQGLAGLGQPVEILEDRWGVLHVRAQSIPDAYFADGYLIARDRLWELDFGHRQSLGRLAEVFGPAFVPSDTANRLVLFRGDAEGELAAFPQLTQDCARAYVAGINARIVEVSATPGLLPPEFGIFATTPLHWDVLDLIRIRAEVTGNTRTEIRRARLAARGALAYDALITPLEPVHDLRVPDGLDTAAISETDLGLFGVLQAPLPRHDIRAAADDGTRRRNEGSNAWVIAPSRTATGRPILANDPHLSFGVPGPRHVIHLTAPGLDVIGGGGAGMPGVMQGHNATIAFGRTNFHIDQEDLFILRTNPADPLLYAHQGGWKRMEQVETRIAVRGEAERVVSLFYSVHGPVVSRDPARNRATAVSATWLAPGANGLLANIGINLAHDWPSFREALRVHTSPTNFTYADTSGNIGWQAAGGLPRRAPGHDGLMPAPGDGRYDWQGLQPLEALPSSFNPARGWFGTSNEMNLPPDYPVEERRVSFEWRDGFRHERVAQMLDATPHATLADSVALQHDTLSVLALQMVRLLPDVPPDLAAEAALLKAWNGRVDASSAAAALYEVWWTRLERALHALIIPPALHDLLPGPVNATVQLSLFQSPDARFGADPVSARNRMLVEQFREAVQELRKRLGPLPAAWRWGALHTITLRHPLASVPAIAAAFPTVGGPSAQSGGDPYTVMARWYSPQTGGADAYATTGGASYLMVCDVGHWDRSLYLNFPGQSADPKSPHYADFLPVWLRGVMQPLSFSPHSVDAAAVRRITLRPEAQP